MAPPQGAHQAYAQPPPQVPPMQMGYGYQQQQQQQQTLPPGVMPPGVMPPQGGYGGPPRDPRRRF